MTQHFGGSPRLKGCIISDIEFSVFALIMQFGSLHIYIYGSVLGGAPPPSPPHLWYPPPPCGVGGGGGAGGAGGGSTSSNHNSSTT